MAALLAGELDAALALFRLDPVRRAALAADGLDAGRALLHDDGLLFHRFADQALGLFTQGLFRQSSSPPLESARAITHLSWNLNRQCRLRPRQSHNCLRHAPGTSRPHTAPS